MFRSACPAALARPSIYAAKRVSCGLGALFLPTKQFYIKMIVYNTVVLNLDGHLFKPQDGKTTQICTRLAADFQGAFLAGAIGFEYLD
jgi:hypothetical protein